MVGSLSSSYSTKLIQNRQLGVNSFEHAASLGSAIAETAHTTFADLITTNNVIMKGGSLADNSTLETFLHGGAFLDVTVDKVRAMDTMGTMIQGQAINQLWRQNKIFILGGGACGDNEGLGSGPQLYVYCDPKTNKAWYMFFWMANDVISVTPHQWGWMAPPPGADDIGQGLFPNISMSDVIVSSINTWKADHNGYNYTASMFQNRTADALKNGWADPREEGPRWEGIFQIPVCDIGVMKDVDFQGKEYVLQDYGHESRPNWCAPICSNSTKATKAFIHAANMDNFKSPRHMCNNDPGY